MESDPATVVGTEKLYVQCVWGFLGIDFTHIFFNVRVLI